jgi:hypothetical protein
MSERERFEDLYELRGKLIKAAEDTTISLAGRELAVTLVEELDAAVAKIKAGLWTSSYYTEQSDCDDYVRELYTYVMLHGRWHDYLVSVKPPSVQPTPSKPYVPAPKVIVKTTAPPVEELF